MSLNFGIGGKPGRSTFGFGNFAEGGRGTAVLWARKDCGDVELSRRRMEKIGREPRRGRGPSIRVILAQRNFWPKDCVLGVAGSERKGVRTRGSGESGGS